MDGWTICGRPSVWLAHGRVLMNERSIDARRSSSSLAAARDDIYWLRAVGLLGVFCVHCSRLTALLGHSSETEAAKVGNALMAVLGLWAMPVLFVASGAAMAIALRQHSPGRFLLIRARRLLLPMALGFLVLVPPQLYLERRLPSQPAGSVLETYRDYLGGAPPSIPGAGLSGSHLWYLLVFFAFSLLLVSLLSVARASWARRLRERAVMLCAKPVMLLLLALPFMFKGVAGGFGKPVGLDPWNLFEYLVMFLYGYALLSDRRVGAAVNDIGPMR